MHLASSTPRHNLYFQAPRHAYVATSYLSILTSTMGATLSAIASWPANYNQIDAAIDETNVKRKALLESQERRRKALEEREHIEGVEEGHEPSQILAYLYLGDRFAARNETVLKHDRIGYVIQMSDKPTPQPILDLFNKLNIVYLRLDSEDTTTDNIIMQFENAIEIINRAKNATAKAKGSDSGNTNCLVYCDEGVSRGPTVVAAYLLHHGWTLRTALAHLNTLRPEINLNQGFFNQLLEEEQTIYGRNSLKKGDYSKYFH
eukprot:m.103019 g.103019  ORF g.103019 m.103019 type:complete len:261 (-) comp15206_c1_seq3:93-875(-)